MIDAVIANPSGPHSIRHRIEFAASASRFELLDEAIENRIPIQVTMTRSSIRFQNGRPVLSVHTGGKRDLQRQSVAPTNPFSPNEKTRINTRACSARGNL